MVTYGQPNLGRMNSHPQAEYTVIRDGEVLGTFSAEQLSSGVKRGTLLVTDHYWREGWPEWQSLADLSPSKARSVSTKERMELRHVGIALVMLLGIAALGFAAFVIIVRSNQVVVGTGNAPALVRSPAVAPTVVQVESTAPPAQQKAAGFTVPDDELLTDSEKQAEELYQRAIKLLREGGWDQNATERFRLFQQAAEQGHVDAQSRLGGMYLMGLGVSQDRGKAAEWFSKAAEQGHAGAQDNLAMLYSWGDGVPQDSAKALEWLTRAADQGYANAQNNLGIRLRDGDGVAKNAKNAMKAVEWFTKAAAQDDFIAQVAQFNLALMYSEGDGISKDDAKAIEWLTKAAKSGWAEPQFHLGLAYARGEGAPKDFVKAAEWYRKAAEQGKVDAQFYLGLSYATGEGVPKDDVQAHCWWNIAGGGARKNLPELEKHMTPDQIAEAQAMAREFKPRKALTERDDANPKTIADSSPKGTGTGFFITTDGYFVTNHHVVEESSQIRVNSGNGIKIARIIRVDKANDLALLKVEGTFSALPIESSRPIALGNTVATVGFPNTSLMGFSPKLAKGDIASLAGIRDDPRYFQISVPVQPGNSGGALVDGVGNVVGVVSAKLSARAALAATGTLPENVNYAVKSSFLLSFLESAPELVGKLPDPYSGERKFEDVVKEVQQASVLVLVY
jgi:TPR repeat protein/S1-C subfamily serine protease